MQTYVYYDPATGQVTEADTGPAGVLKPKSKPYIVTGAPPALPLSQWKVAGGALVKAG